MRPVIGLIPLYDDDKESYWMLPGYMKALERCGALPYDRKAHNVEVLEGTLLASIIGAGIHEVNSYHHQAVRSLAPSVEPMAISEDGLTEAIAVRDRTFAMGIQWHPEFSYETSIDSTLIMQAFVDACAAWRK